MADSAFSVLGLELAVVLEEELVQRRWQQGSQQLHPDADAGDAQRFAQLRAARDVLLDPARRLREVVTVVWGEPERGVSELSADLEELFSAMQRVLPRAAEFARRWEAASTKLSKALLQKQQMELLGELQGAMMRNGERLQAELAGLEPLDERLREQERDEQLRRDLLAAAGRLRWLLKWREQLSAAAGRLW